MKKLDILIVTKLSKGRFFNLTKSIKDNVEPDTLDACTFYVCYTGDSDDEKKAIRENLKWQGLDGHLIQMPYNFAKCNNALARLGVGDNICLINDDIELKADSITYALSILEHVKKIGGVGLKLMYGDSPNVIQHFGQRLVVRAKDQVFIGVDHLLGKHKDIETPDIIVQGITGAFFMLRRADWNAVGGLDEGYIHCFEDVQLSWALRALGKSLVCIGKQHALHFESSTRGPGDIERADVERLVHYYHAHRAAILNPPAPCPFSLLEV